MGVDRPIFSHMDKEIVFPNVDVFDCFKDVERKMDEYFEKMTTIGGDDNENLKAFFENHIATVIVDAVGFLNTERSFQEISQVESYSMDDILRLFRRYLNFMVEKFETYSNHFSPVAYTDNDDVLEVIEVVNKTIIVIFMERILNLIGNEMEKRLDGKILDDTAAAMLKEKTNGEDGINEMFNKIVEENWNEN